MELKPFDMARSSQPRIGSQRSGPMFDSGKGSHSYSSREVRNGLSDSNFNVQCYQKPAFMNSYDTSLKNRNSFTMDYGTRSSFGSGTRAGGGWGEPRQNTMLDNNSGQYSFIGSIPYNPAFCKMDATPKSSQYASKNANFFYTPQSNVKQGLGGTSMEYGSGLKRSLTFSMGSNPGENIPFQDSLKSTVPKYSSTLLDAGGSPDIHAKHCRVYNEMLFDKNLSTFRESSLYRNISECENSYHKPKTLDRDRRQIKANGLQKVVGNPPSEQKHDDVTCSIKSCDNTASNLDSPLVKVQNNWCNISVNDEESTSVFKEAELVPQEEEDELSAVSDSNNVMLRKDSSDGESLLLNDASKSKLNRHSDTSINESNSPRSQDDENQAGNWTLPVTKTVPKWTRMTQKLSAGELGKKSLFDTKKQDNKKWTRMTQKLSAGEIETETPSESEEEDEEWTDIIQKLKTGETEKQTLSDSKKEVENSEDNIETDNENIIPEQITRKQKQNSCKKGTDLSLASLTEEILSAIKEQKSLVNMANDNISSDRKEACNKSDPKHSKHDFPVSRSKSQLRYDVESASSEIRVTSNSDPCVPKILGKLQTVKKDFQEATKEQTTAKQSSRPSIVRTGAIFGQYPSGLEKAKDKISGNNQQHSSSQTKEEVPRNKEASNDGVSKTSVERSPSTILIQRLRAINNNEGKETEKSAQETMEEEQQKGGNDHVTDSNSSTTFSVTQEKLLAAKKRNMRKLAWEQWCAMKREKELELKKKEMINSKTKVEQLQKTEEEKRKKQEENQENYERWLRDKREKDKEKKRIAAKKTAEEKRKEAIEKKREQRREEFKEAFQTWLKEKENKLLEQKHQIEEARRRKEEEEKERRRQCEKAFEEWKMKAVDRPKPMSVKIYDPLTQRHPAPRPSMYINPKPWASDF